MLSDGKARRTWVTLPDSWETVGCSKLDSPRQQAMPNIWLFFTLLLCFWTISSSFLSYHSIMAGESNLFYCKN